MALCAALCSLRPDYEDEEEQQSVIVRTSCLQNQQLNLDLTFADQANISIDQLDVLVTGPGGQIISNKELMLSKRRTDSNKGAILSLVPQQVGSYTVGFCSPKTSPKIPILSKID
jgi:hypothetical protein